MTSPSVTIDAGVLAVPGEHASKDEAYRYVETIVDWSTLLDEPWVAICMSERASEALFADGLYPLRDQLRQLFRANGVTEYDVNTVATVADRLLQLTPSLESYFRVRDVLAEDVTTIPDVLQVCSGVRLQSDLARCVVLIAILRAHCHAPVQNHALVLRQAQERLLGVRAVIHDLDHSRDDLPCLTSSDSCFEGDVLVCHDFRGLLECIDEAVVLKSATDDVAVETAIRIALYKSRIARSGEPDWSETRGLKIGRGFGDSLRRCCRDAPGSFLSIALRAIVETLEGEQMRAVHELRTGMGGGDPQRVRGRDQATAWRRDVDYNYHLHYWKCRDGAIELASVGVHNDFAIPE